MELLREVVNDDSKPKTLISSGWECPKCCKVVNPKFKHCPTCEKEVKESTNRDNRQVLMG